MNDELERLAAYLAHLHPAWRATPWAEIGEGTRDLFRAEARQAAAILRGER